MPVNCLSRISEYKVFAVLYLDKAEQKAYLVNTSGTITKAGRYVKDGNDEYYAVISQKADGSYEIKGGLTLEEAKTAIGK